MSAEDEFLTDLLSLPAAELVEKVFQAARERRKGEHAAGVLDLAEVGRRCVVWRERELPPGSPVRSALQICEEAGEVARAAGKASEGIRADTRGDLADELGDVVLSVCAMAAEEGIDLAAVVRRRLERMEGLTFGRGQGAVEGGDPEGEGPPR